MFVVPSRDKAITAMGTLKQTPKEKSLDAQYWSTSFKHIHLPGPADWLNGPGIDERDGQTFSQFKKQHSRRVKPDSTIVLVPLGEFEQTSLQLDDIDSSDDETHDYVHDYLLQEKDILPAGVDITFLAAVVEAFFGLKVLVHPTIPHSELLDLPHRDAGVGGIQFQTGPVQKMLHKLQQKHKAYSKAVAVVGITMNDLYPGKGWNFVFGEADTVRHTGVFGFARYSCENPKRFLRRCTKTMVHEIGHLFDLEHCVWFDCIMNGANHLEEDDRTCFHLCPVDLRKLMSAIPQIDPVERYKALLGLFAQVHFNSEVRWLQHRLAMLGEGLPEPKLKKGRRGRKSSGEAMETEGKADKVRRDELAVLLDNLDGVEQKGNC
eukprot:TRINITY_DN67962_c7_g3_i1.p1 TRINITY_DN67962_c7_g3~~TRINITY_DN67962_c7_g3_i1.p1  ORF type:complete len:377 (-),score=26.77 TRINITY_DN67962_c7_g3_i1:487-1617(-)